jgi:hypothetical protein
MLAYGGEDDLYEPRIVIFLEAGMVHRLEPAFQKQPTKPSHASSLWIQVLLRFSVTSFLTTALLVKRGPA